MNRWADWDGTEPLSRFHDGQRPRRTRRLPRQATTVAIVAVALGCGGTTLLGGPDEEVDEETGTEAAIDSNHPDDGEDSGELEQTETADAAALDAGIDADDAEVGTDVDEGPCPGNLAGRLETGYDGVFEWSEWRPNCSVGADDRVVVRFALIPFPIGATSFSLYGHRSMPDEGDFQQFGELVFEYGLVHPFGITDGGLPYLADAWNVVQYSVDVLGGRYDLTVNGDTTSGRFNLDGMVVDSVNGFRIGDYRTYRPCVAWLDGLSVVRWSGGVPDAVYSEDFSSFERVDAVGGDWVVPAAPEIPLLDPIACEVW
jgi:hypothetical protein